MPDARPDPADDLMLLAWQFAAGELPPERAAAFAARLGHDFPAQQALAEAIRRSAAALGQTPPAPDPLRRSAIRDELRGGVWAGVLGRRPYRGHPLTWAGLGATASVGLTALGLWLADVRPSPVARAPLSDAAGLPPPSADVLLRVSLPGPARSAGALAAGELGRGGD